MKATRDHSAQPATDNPASAPLLPDASHKAPSHLRYSRGGLIARQSFTNMVLAPAAAAVIDYLHPPEAGSYYLTPSVAVTAGFMIASQAFGHARHYTTLYSRRTLALKLTKAVYFSLWLVLAAVGLRSQDGSVMRTFLLGLLPACLTALCALAAAAYYWRSDALSLNDPHTLRNLIGNLIRDLVWTWFGFYALDPSSFNLGNDAFLQFTSTIQIILFTHAISTGLFHLNHVFTGNTPVLSISGHDLLKPTTEYSCGMVGWNLAGVMTAWLVGVNLVGAHNTYLFLTTCVLMGIFEYALQNADAMERAALLIARHVFCCSRVKQERLIGRQPSSLDLIPGQHTPQNHDFVHHATSESTANPEAGTVWNLAFAAAIGFIASAEPGQVWMIMCTVAFAVFAGNILSALSAQSTAQDHRDFPASCPNPTKRTADHDTTPSLYTLIADRPKWPPKQSASSNHD